MGRLRPRGGQVSFEFKSGHMRCVNQHMWRARWPAPTIIAMECIPYRDTGVEHRLRYKCLISQYRHDRHIHEYDVLNLVRSCWGI